MPKHNQELFLMILLSNKQQRLLSTIVSVAIANLNQTSDENCFLFYLFETHFFLETVVIPDQCSVIVLNFSSNRLASTKFITENMVKTLFTVF